MRDAIERMKLERRLAAGIFIGACAIALIAALVWPPPAQGPPLSERPPAVTE
ncbi:MAG: hypothetical protein KJ052_00960 [Candidatus Hydrogenedentes bacterium]|nr:hypothetical protein [Candidatus Hydrogenedentota bacterium]